MVARRPAHSYDSYQSGSFLSAAIRPRFDTDPAPKPARHSRKTTMVQTVQKNIRVTPEQWECIEKAADVNGGAKRDHLGGVRRDRLAAAGLSP